MKLALVALAILTFSAPAQAQSAAELKLPSPIAPEPRVVTEQDSSPVYYRKSPRLLLPTFRSGLGLVVRIPTDDITAKAAFTLDMYAGFTARFRRGAETGLLGEAGYSYVGFSEHLLSAGVGFLHGLGRPAAKPGETQPIGRSRFGIVPHALVGYAYGDSAKGARTSVFVGYWIYGLEMAHQVLFVGDRQIHEARLTFTTILAMGDDE